MSIRHVVYSDISGKPVNEAGHARIVVIEHPLLNGSSVELDVSQAEAQKLQVSKIDLVSLLIQEPDSRPRRVVMDAAAFAQVFKGVDIESVLREARPVGDDPAAPPRKRRGRPKGTTRPAATKSDKIVYSDPQHAGNLHRGRVTDAEAAVVRKHLNEINERLAAEGRPIIDPKDPKAKARYGF
jgi:hypothetical protein